MTENQETRSDKPDKTRFTFEVFGSWGVADGNAMIDMAMASFLHPKTSQDKETIPIMIDRGREIYMSYAENPEFLESISLEAGDDIITPAGFMKVSTHGTETLIHAFTKVLDEERKYGDLKRLGEKIKDEFYYILGYFSVLWEMEDVMGSKTVKWLADKRSTDKLVDKSVRFVSILLSELDNQIREDLR